MYCDADWDRLEERKHILSNDCLATRKKMMTLIAGLDVAWHWSKRKSTAEGIRANALSRAARGELSATTVSRSGLTRHQLLQCVAQPDRESSGEVEQQPEDGALLYERCPEAPNVFTRRRTFNAGGKS